MSFQSIGGLIHAAAGRGEVRPVLRGSTQKPVRWGRMSRVERARRYEHAARFDRLTKVKGRHGGAIGPTALKVYHTLLFGFFNLKTGQLDPSYEQIAQKANLCRKAVWAALVRLRELGLVDWVRRCRNGHDGAGRFVLRQVSNAYFILPESEWRRYSPAPKAPSAPEPGSWGAPAPVLDGLAQYNADRALGLSQADAAAALARVASSRLEVALASLYAGMTARQAGMASTASAVAATPGF